LPVVAVIATLPFRTSNPLDPSQANVYNIYPQPDQHVCLMTKHLDWTDWLWEHTGHPLDQDDYIFPDINRDDQVDLNHHFSVKDLLAVMNKFAADAGLRHHHRNENVSFDEHSFRRGGARHQLFYARDKWSLKAVLWWGGWTDEDPAEQIIDYLLGHPHTEGDFGDMLSPHENRARGLAYSTQDPANMFVKMEKQFKSTIVSLDSRYAASLAKIKNESRETRSRYETKLAKIDGMMKSMEYRGAVAVAKMEKESRDMEFRHQAALAKIEEMVKSIEHRNAVVMAKTKKESRETELRYQAALAKIDEEHRDITRQNQQIQQQNVEMKREILKMKQQNMELCHNLQQVNKELHQENSDLRQESELRYKALHQEVSEFGDALTRDLQKAQEMASRDPESPLHPQVEDQEFETQSQPHSENEKYADQRPSDREDLVEGSLRDLPQDQACFPDGPSAQQPEPSCGDSTNIPYIPKIFHWTDAIRQWDHGDSENGLAVPLKEWSSFMRANNRNFRKRKAIVEEFEFFERNQALLEACHGENVQGVDKLLRSIWQRRKKGDRHYADIDLKEPGVQRSKEQTINNVKEEELKEQSQQDGEELDEEGGSDEFIAQTIPRISHWKEAILQWDGGDPDKGLTIPLHKWPSEFRQMHQDTIYPRQTVAKEFEFFGRDEAKMREVYGDSMSGPLKKLVAAIRERHRFMKKQSEDQMDTDNEDTDNEEDGGDNESKSEDGNADESENENDESESVDDDDDESKDDKGESEDVESESKDNDDNGSESEEEDRPVRKRKRVSHVGHRAAPEKTKAVSTRVQPPRHVK
ncbi:hypothetical protein BGZ59_000407, partial [Podila verticillata]